MTLLEVIAAVTLLAMTASAISGAIGFVLRAQQRNVHRLACAELANQLILQYLDDPESLPDRRVPLYYGPPGRRTEYHFSIDEYRLPVRAERELEQKRQTPVTLDNLSQIHVRVWLGGDEGAGVVWDGAAPSVAITRFVNPMAFYERNPDSFHNQISSDAGLRTILDQIQGQNLPPPPGGTGDQR